MFYSGLKTIWSASDDGSLRWCLYYDFVEHRSMRLCIFRARWSSFTWMKLRNMRSQLSQSSRASSDLGPCSDFLRSGSGDLVWVFLRMYRDPIERSPHLASEWRLCFLRSFDGDLRYGDNSLRNIRCYGVRTSCLPRRVFENSIQFKDSLFSIKGGVVGKYIWAIHTRLSIWLDNWYR